jgi:hypothetical protein
MAPGAAFGDGAGLALVSVVVLGFRALGGGSGFGNSGKSSALANSNFKAVTWQWIEELGRVCRPVTAIIASIILHQRPLVAPPFLDREPP